MRRTQKEWSAEEDAIVRDKWSAMTSSELMSLLPGRTRNAITARATKQLGLSKNRGHRTAEEYFKRYTPDRPVDGCWRWTGTLTVQGIRSRGGYGVAYCDGRSIYAHRLSFLLARGHLPDGLDILHKCDNPACVNPGHLYAGTDSDNQRDVIERRRRKLVLTPDAVRRARQMHAEGLRYYEIGRALGVAGPVVRGAITGHSWRWVR